MSIDFDITTPNSAYEFLLKNLDFQEEELVMEYLVECGGDAELFAERNVSRKPLAGPVVPKSLGR